VWGVGLGVGGLGFVVWGLGFRSRVYGLEFRYGACQTGDNAWKVMTHSSMAPTPLKRLPCTVPKSIIRFLPL